MKIETLRKICEGATPGPWIIPDGGDKSYSDIGRYEPYTDGSEGRGSWFPLIQRDSGYYLPRDGDVDYLTTFHPALVAKLLDVVEAASEYVYQAGTSSDDLKNALEALDANE